MIPSKETVFFYFAQCVFAACSSSSFSLPTNRLLPLSLQLVFRRFSRRYFSFFLLCKRFWFFPLCHFAARDFTGVSASFFFFIWALMSLCLFGTSCLILPCCVTTLARCLLAVFNSVFPHCYCIFLQSLYRRPVPLNDVPRGI